MDPADRQAAAEVPDEILEETLADPRRRLILRILRDQNGPIPLVDVAAAVRAHEIDSTPRAVSATDRRDVCEDIFSHHLPKLAAIGLVEYDSVRGTVEPGPVDVADRVP